MPDLQTDERVGKLARRNNSGTGRRCLASIPLYDSPLIIRHGRRLGARVDPQSPVTMHTAPFISKG